MSKLSIYETRWIDQVFENKNRNYGAYQLRHDSVKSSLRALFMGLLFIATIGVVTTTINHLNPNSNPIAIPIQEWSDPIQVTQVVLSETAKTTLPKVKTKVTEIATQKELLTNPIIAHADEEIKEVATNIEAKSVPSTAAEESTTIGINPTPGTGIEAPKPVDYGTTIVNSTALDKLPEYPGGMKNFYNYVGNNFEKPEMEEIGSLKVYVSFVIEKDGSMSNIKVMRDPGYGLGQEAIRVLKSLRTKWSPGIIDSKPVRTSYNLPILIETR
jgi:protein TonB